MDILNKLAKTTATIKKFQLTPEIRIGPAAVETGGSTDSNFRVSVLSYI